LSAKPLSIGLAPVVIAREECRRRSGLRESRGECAAWPQRRFAGSGTAFKPILRWTIL